MTLATLEIQEFSEFDESVGTPTTDARILIPEGIYEVLCIGHDGPIHVFGPDEARIFLHFKVIAPERYKDTRMFQSFKCYSPWPPRSKYYQNWSIASGAMPRARTRMSPKVFEHKTYRAQVKTAVPKYENGPLKGTPKPKIVHYSVVDELLEVIEGGDIHRSAKSNQESLTSHEYLATSNRGFGK